MNKQTFLPLILLVSAVSLPVYGVGKDKEKKKSSSVTMSGNEYQSSSRAELEERIAENAASTKQIIVEDNNNAQSLVATSSEEAPKSKAREALHKALVNYEPQSYWRGAASDLSVEGQRILNVIAPDELPAVKDDDLKAEVLGGLNNPLTRLSAMLTNYTRELKLSTVRIHNALETKRKEEANTEAATKIRSLYIQDLEMTKLSDEIKRTLQFQQDAFKNIVILKLINDECSKNKTHKPKGAEGEASQRPIFVDDDKLAEIVGVAQALQTSLKENQESTARYTEQFDRLLTQITRSISDKRYAQAEATRKDLNYKK